mgnify:FL=1
MWTSLTTVPRRGRRWPGALRVAAAAAIPGLIGVASGQGAVAAVAAVGAFAAVYGEGRPYRVRWRAVSVAAAVMVVLAAVGAMTGSVVYSALSVGATPLWWMVLVAVMTAVVAVGAFVVDGLRLGAPGAFLPLLTVEIASALPAAGVTVRQVVMWTSIGAVTAIATSMSGLLGRPRTAEKAAVGTAIAAVETFLCERTSHRRREAVRALHTAWHCLHDARLVSTDHRLTAMLSSAHRRCAEAIGAPVAAGSKNTAVDPRGEADALGVHIPLPRPAIMYRLRRACRHGDRSGVIVIRIVIACWAAGLLAVVCEIDRPDWAMITAAMILHQGPDRIAGTYRGVHRFVGTVVGLVVLAVIAAGAFPAAGFVVAIAVLAAAMEVFLVRNYGVAMVFITPIAMLLGSLGSEPDIATAVRDRLYETGIGVTVALLVLWSIAPRFHRRILRDADRRIVETIKTIATASQDEIPELMGDLEFDLHTASTAVVVAAHTDPRWTRGRWADHHRLHELGDHILTRATATVTDARERT